jgi:MerR family transcriptional regulator, thiopeptide resistance regulator
VFGLARSFVNRSVSSSGRPLQYSIGAGGTRAYQIQEFAQLAGTTVRALQHYDRLGLLSPLRAANGTRLYSTADLQALVQILALKSVGVPLKRIALLRAIGPRAMAEALEAERRALERKQPLIDRVIFAIRNVEAALGRGEDADPTVLGPLMAALKSDESDTAGEEERIAYEPSAAWDELQRDWRTLLADVEQGCHLDPSGSEMQELAERWDQLMTRSTGGGSYRPLIAQSTAALDMPASARATSAERTFTAVGVALSRWAVSARDGRGPQRR